MERQMSFHGLPAKGVESLWRAQYADHKRKVLNFFGSDRRFCHFVLERDNASKIASFVSPDYDLYPARFEHINRSKSD
ncbi:hypothetical protein PARPLA_02455 [Rhodobacteraceae bacterium THAF1]|nr:hypothetical protein PARPLA_02455 [Rhodobacteraceae bacterium THAF1]